MSDFAIGCICLTIILTLLVALVIFGQRRTDRLALAATPAPSPAPPLATRLRKAAPYLLFLGLGAAAVTGPLWFSPLIDFIYQAGHTAGPAATGAENAAGQQASGWVPSATVASKFVTAAGVLILFVVLIWRLQNLTHPEPSRWAKHEYTGDWQQLTVAEKFEAYGRIRLQYVILAVGAMLFAALVV